MERNRIKHPASNLKINTDHENSKNMQRVSYLIAKAPAKKKRWSIKLSWWMYHCTYSESLIKCNQFIQKSKSPPYICYSLVNWEVFTNYLLWA